MRVALVAETFLPQMNGVVNSVLQVLAHLQALGHQTLVIAPHADRSFDLLQLHGAELVELRSVALPNYPEVRTAFTNAGKLRGILQRFAPDVVHLASPFILGWQALRAADQLGIPTVAIYQTDIPGYALRYGLPAAGPALSHHVARIHQRATLTLAPSRSSIDELRGLGVERLRLWTRGVDGELFHPARRSDRIRSELAPSGEVLIGYVGRLAREKQVEDLAAIADIPGTRLVIIGDGPSREALERALPDAAFRGFRSGADLAAHVASLDVFVHPGENETFCQTIQEALASGVPVVATGRGGPLDLVQNSRTGWLYRPGDLGDLRARILDLVGDSAKRRAFAVSAHESVIGRTWAHLGDELLAHYRDAITGAVVPEGITQRHSRPARYVALGDSLTEGLSDSSRQTAGEYRGWADRLAMLLAHAGGREPLLYANLAVRSRKVADVLDEQIPRALTMRPDLVSVLIGGNDLVRIGARPEKLAAKLGAGIAQLRASGAEVLVITPFAPRRPYLRSLQHRLERFNQVLRWACAESGAIMVDVAGSPLCSDPRAWAQDRVHLNSHGHRVLAYRAAVALGVPGATELGELDLAMHDDPGAHDLPVSTARWIWLYLRPWLSRRARGRLAGDGRMPKHVALVPVFGTDGTGAHAPTDVAR